jgi:hypothetical protein
VLPEVRRAPHGRVERPLGDMTTGVLSATTVA